jgi:small subunit ribosomal protein S9
MAEKTKKDNLYFGTGRRKTAVARVSLNLNKGDILVNEKPIQDFFTDKLSQKIANQPFQVADRVDTFSGIVKLAGGGIKAQAEAVSLGFARALVAYDSTLRAPLAKASLLTRDPRMKESRKYGLGGKARKGKQSPKR